MASKSILSIPVRAKLLALPDNREELIRLYALTERELALTRQRTTPENQLGYAVLLCYMRFPGVLLGKGEKPYQPLLEYVAEQLGVSPETWRLYRPETRREHLAQIKDEFGYVSFSTATHYPIVLEELEPTAFATDEGEILANHLLDYLRSKQILLPAIDVIDKICSKAAREGTKRVHQSLNQDLKESQKKALDQLLEIKPNTQVTTLTWLRQPPGPPNPDSVLAHLERIKTIEALSLPDPSDTGVSQNRLLKIVRTSKPLRAQDIERLRPPERYATLRALVAEAHATLIDQVIDLHRRNIANAHSFARSKHKETLAKFAEEMVRSVDLFGRTTAALAKAREKNEDAFEAIARRVLPWEKFLEAGSLARTLVKRQELDPLHFISESFPRIWKYAGEFLSVLRLRTTLAGQPLYDAVMIVKKMADSDAEDLPADPPVAFVTPLWRHVVFRDKEVDSKYYILCAMSALVDRIESGDIWVEGSRQFKAFEDHLLPKAKFQSMREQGLPLSIPLDCNTYLDERLKLLKKRLRQVDELVRLNQLQGVKLSADKLTISRLKNAVPSDIEALARKVYALLPNIKITALLEEMNRRVNFAQHFKNVRTGKVPDDVTDILTLILGAAINVGTSKMAAACPGKTRATLDTLRARCITDQAYASALAELVNEQHLHPMTSHWGDGTKSSSDAQEHKIGGRGYVVSAHNPKYGSEPGVMFYIHISDGYAVFHSKVIHAGMAEAPFVLDGLLYHESDLRIVEHYTDTAGATDHVFALAHMFGYRFIPRIKNFGARTLYLPDEERNYPGLAPLLGDQIDAREIRANWDDVLRMATSVKAGTVTASLLLRKLGKNPKQNRLSAALAQLGQIERTLFMLDWIASVELRRRAQVALNKGEAMHALARAVSFYRGGKMAEYDFQQLRFRASGLNLVVAAIILWNTIYLDRAVKQLRTQGVMVDKELLGHISPLGWEHINLTGDYVWGDSPSGEGGEFRDLNDPDDDMVWGLPID